MRGAARNAAMLLGGEAASRVFGFLTTAWLARRLGLDGFGQVGFALAILAYGVVATDFGLLTMGTRSAARDRDSIPRLVGSVIPMRMLLSLAAVAAMLLLALVLPGAASVKWLMVIYAAGIAVQSLVLEWVFTGTEQMGRVAIARILTSGGYYALTLILVKGTGQILLVPVAFVGATLLGALLLFVFYVPRFGPVRLSFGRLAWMEIARSAWPIGLASVLTQVHVNLGVVGMGLFRSYSETGLYSSAYRLVFFLMALDRVFYTVFLPVVSRIMNGQRERLPELTGTATRLILAIGLPICAGTLLLARPIIGLVFGPGYAGAALSLQVLVWFLVLSMFNSLAGYTLVSAGMERQFLRNTLIGVGASVLFNLVAIPLLGDIGAAFALVAGEGAILVAMLRDFLRVVRPRLSLRILAPPAATLLMVPVVLLTRPLGLGAAVGFGILVYAVAVILLRGITPADLGLVRST